MPLSNPSARRSDRIMEKMSVTILTVFLLAEVVTGASRLICPNQLIKVAEGNDVIIQCHLDPPRDVSAYTMDWSRVDLDEVVYSYRDRGHNRDEQMERYRNRTTFDLDGLSRGNLTLRISSAQLDDSGPYRCFVLGLNISCVVNVSVVTKDQQKRTKTKATTTRPPVEVGEKMKTTTVLTIVLPVVVVVVPVAIVGVVLVKRNQKCQREQEAEMAPNNVQMENLMNPGAAEEGEDLDISVENIQQEV